MAPLKTLEERSDSRVFRGVWLSFPWICMDLLRPVSHRQFNAVARHFATLMKPETYNEQEYLCRKFRRALRRYTYEHGYITQDKVQIYFEMDTVPSKIWEYV